MRNPNWPDVVLNPDILVEPMVDKDRIVLWIPGTSDGSFQFWERVSNVARAEVESESGISSIPATSIKARQPMQGLFGRIWQRLRKPTAESGWVLPNGASAEQYGERQDDLVLLWSDDAAVTIDESKAKARWPDSKELRRLGPNSYVLSGVKPDADVAGIDFAAVSDNPLLQSEGILATARARGDLKTQAAALADQGVIHLQTGNPQGALALLEEAWSLSRQIDDPARQSDVLMNLGLALARTDQSQRAFEILTPELARVRQAGDRLLEKNLLDRIGLAYSRAGQLDQSISSFEQALAIAREVGDRKHETELLWYLSIQFAEQGLREQAIAHAQATVDILQAKGNPQAEWYAKHLHDYRTGGVNFTQAPSSAHEGSPGQLVSNLGNPGYLRMALNAAKSMTKFVGSGFKTTSGQTQRRRLSTCATCEHHTGVRCRVCGCFTGIKSRLPYEDCPIGKWPK